MAENYPVFADEKVPEEHRDDIIYTAGRVDGVLSRITERYKTPTRFVLDKYAEDVVVRALIIYRTLLSIAISEGVFTVPLMPLSKETAEYQVDFTGKEIRDEDPDANGDNTYTS